MQQPLHSAKKMLAPLKYCVITWARAQRKKILGCMQMTSIFVKVRANQLLLAAIRDSKDWPS